MEIPLGDLQPSEVLRQSLGHLQLTMLICLKVRCAFEINDQWMYGKKKTLEFVVPRTYL